MGWWAPASVGCTVLKVCMWRGSALHSQMDLEAMNWAAPKNTLLCTKNGTKYNKCKSIIWFNYSAILNIVAFAFFDFKVNVLFSCLWRLLIQTVKDTLWISLFLFKSCSQRCSKRRRKKIHRREYFATLLYSQAALSVHPKQQGGGEKQRSVWVHNLACRWCTT